LRSGQASAAQPATACSPPRGSDTFKHARHGAGAGALADTTVSHGARAPGALPGRTQPSQRHELRPAAERRASRPPRAVRGPRMRTGPPPASATRSEAFTPSLPPGRDRHDAPGAEGGTATLPGHGWQSRSSLHANDRG
jgi:hypothetical protein